VRSSSLGAAGAAAAAACSRCRSSAFLPAHRGCLAGAVQSQADWRCAGAPPPVDELRQRLHKRLEVRAPPAAPAPLSASARAPTPGRAAQALRHGRHADEAAAPGADGKASQVQAAREWRRQAAGTRCGAARPPCCLSVSRGRASYRTRRPPRRKARQEPAAQAAAPPAPAAKRARPAAAEPDLLFSRVELGAGARPPVPVPAPEPAVTSAAGRRGAEGYAPTARRAAPQGAAEEGGQGGAAGRRAAPAGAAEGARGHRGGPGAAARRACCACGAAEQAPGARAHARPLRGRRWPRRRAGRPRWRAPAGSASWTTPSACPGARAALAACPRLAGGCPAPLATGLPRWRLARRACAGRGAPAAGR